MKIYTKTGDDGTTSLFDGTRVSKHDMRVELYGTSDELNSVLGLAVSFCQSEDLTTRLLQIQRDLFALGAKLANPKEKKQKEKADFDDSHTDRLESEIDKMEAELPQMTSFILPGGTPAAAQLHHARTICRKLERLMVSHQKQIDMPSTYLEYVNRLSDHLFVCARYANHSEGTKDIPWT